MVIIAKTLYDVTAVLLKSAAQNRFWEETATLRCVSAAPVCRLRRTKLY
jgi:hypothetical protein